MGACSEGAARHQLPRTWHLFGDDAILPRLLLLAKMIERETSRQLQLRFKMSVAQWRVLAFVCISGPATAAFIGESAEVDQAEISRAVKGLVEASLVTREFEVGSRKKRAIAPTPAGLEQFRRVRQVRHDYFARMTDKLGPADKDQLIQNLQTLAEEFVAERNSNDRER